MSNFGKLRERLAAKNRAELEERLGIVCAYKKAQENFFELHDIIAAAQDRDEARDMLMMRWGFDEKQASAVLEMRQYRYALDERRAVDEEIALIEELLGK